MNWLQADKLPCPLCSLSYQHWHSLREDYSVGNLIVTQEPLLANGDYLIIPAVQSDG
jgi:hypothetical protein